MNSKLFFVKSAFIALTISFASPTLVKAEPLISNPSEIQSVGQVIQQIQGLLDFQEWCDTRSCIAPRTIQVCSLVEMLNLRVNGLILNQNIRSRNALSISSTELELMQKIWSHCRVVPASEVFVGAEGSARIYSPQRCRDRNEISTLLKLPVEDCSYEERI